MSKSTWITDGEGDWADAQNWSPVAIPGASSDVAITVGDAVASASIGMVNSITVSSSLRFQSAGTNTVATFLDNSGGLRVDRKGGAGGTILNIAGALTNSGSLRVGNATLSAPNTVTAASLDNTGGGIRLLGSSASQALLDVTGSAGFGAAETLRGYVRLAGDSAIEFASGEITSLAARTQLHLNGSDAFIEDSTAPGSNSALTGLNSIGSGAYFELENKAAVSTTGSLSNDGFIRLDYAGGDGGSSLMVGETLTNSGSLTLGNATLSAPDTVTAASLDNTGQIYLNGSSANQALLDVTAGSAGFGAAGVLSGKVELAGDSAIEFKSGQITSLANGAQLHLNGYDAFIEDSAVLGSNSALTGLASIGAGAQLGLHNGASVSTTGALANDGNVNVAGGHGGSRLTVAGALTNTGSVQVNGTGKLTAPTLSNSGYIQLSGNATNQQALLDVTTGAAGFGTAGTLTGSVAILQDSAIEFLSGQISTIAASSALILRGNSAFVEDSTALGSNSALTGLADVSGSLYLQDGASVSTTGALTNSGYIDLRGALSIGGALTNTVAGSLYLYDGASLSTTGPVTDSGFLGVDYYYISGGSKLSIAGALTVTGTLDIGNGGRLSSDSVTANSFVNSGTVDLTGNGTNLAALDVSGTTTNNGSISIASDTEELAGAVDGKGSFRLSNANLLFDSSVSAGQTIMEFIEPSGADALTLKQAQSFAATISGFGTGDTIDATNFLAPPATTYNFVENIAGTGGTLTLTDTSLSLTANIQMTGVYSDKSFSLAPDSGTGTLVKFA